ncbi:MAG: hypothetical protein FWG28_08605 [Clostridiales bacterium]|nr:hypothetical protein [Clostridiales bacterium]
MYHPIKLDKDRNLRYGMKAISLIEKKMKKPIAAIDMDEMTMEDVAVILWAGLQHEDKTLTPDKVMDLVDEYSNFADASTAMGEALAAGLGKPDGGQPGDDGEPGQAGEGDEKNAKKAAASSA